MGLNLFLSYSLASQYLLSTKIPFRKSFLASMIISASRLDANLIAIGLPLVGLNLPIRSVFSILSSLALSSLISSLSPFNNTDNSLLTSSRLGSGSSHFSSLIPDNTILFSNNESSISDNFVFSSLFSLSTSLSRISINSCSTFNLATSSTCLGNSESSLNNRFTFVSKGSIRSSNFLLKLSNSNFKSAGSLSLIASLSVMFIFFDGGALSSGDVKDLLVLVVGEFFWIKVEIPGWFEGTTPFNFPAI